MGLMKTLLPVVALCLAMYGTGCKTEGEGMQLDQIMAAMGPKPKRQVLEESIQSAEPDARRKALREMGKWNDADRGLVTLVGLTVLGDSDTMTRVLEIGSASGRARV